MVEDSVAVSAVADGAAAGDGDVVGVGGIRATLTVVVMVIHTPTATLIIPTELSSHVGVNNGTPLRRTRGGICVSVPQAHDHVQWRAVDRQTRARLPAVSLLATPFGETLPPLRIASDTG
jgi:hypothetical protein